MVELDPRATEHEIKAHAVWAIARVKALLSAIGKPKTVARPCTTAAGMPSLLWTNVAATPTTPEQITADLNTIAAQCHARPCAENIQLSGRIARMTDAAWWLRNLRRETVRRNEEIEHQAGAIRRKTQCYATDHAVKVKAARAKANRHTLEGLEVVNETGQAINLLEVADKSVSNPAIRRGELMVRARGFEETAEFMGHGAYFLTITCPSRFHRWSAAGQQNPKWTGDTPRDAQDYLSATWAKIRAAWGRAKYHPYGFRVAEPHHDGCPHWHILLFMPTDHAGWFEPSRLIAGRNDHGAGAIGIAGRYALKDNAAERGASEHRFTSVVIDTTKGSATGYISKYIAKNIDGLTQAGENIGMDFASGQKANDSAARVKTWASTWAIRQFQQIGGPSVTVWRELRRLGEPDRDTTLDLFAGPQDAANEAMWSMFWMLQGGPETPRRKLTLSPEYITDSEGKYGDPVKRIHGVAGTSDGITAQFLQTRLHTWTVQVAGLAEVNAQQAEFRADKASAARVSEFLREAQGFGIGFPAHSAAWTGVNNCTPDTGRGFDFSGFEVEKWEISYLPEYRRQGDPATVAAEVAILESQLCQINRQYQARIN